MRDGRRGELAPSSNGDDHATRAGVGVSPSYYAKGEIAYYPGYEYSDLEPSDDAQKELRTRLRVNHYKETPVLPFDEDTVHPSENIEGLLVQYSNGYAFACDMETPMGHPEMFPFTRAIITDQCSTIYLIVRTPDGRVMLQTIRARDMQMGGAYYAILSQLMMRPLEVSDDQPTKHRPSAVRAHSIRMKDEMSDIGRPGVAAAAAGGAGSPTRRAVNSPKKRVFGSPMTRRDAKGRYTEPKPST